MHMFKRTSIACCVLTTRAEQEASPVTKWCVWKSHERDVSNMGTEKATADGSRRRVLHRTRDLGGFRLRYTVGRSGPAFGIA